MKDWLIRLLEFAKELVIYTFENKYDASEPVPPVKPMPPTPPIPPNNLLNMFCLAIKKHEGWYLGSRSERNHNAGNTRFSRIGYLPIYGIVHEDRVGVKPGQQGFAIFSSYEIGFLYLKNLVKEKIKRHPNWTFYQFFGDEKEGWAPNSDNNDSEHYAEVVAATCSVSPTSKISILV